MKKRKRTKLILGVFLMLIFTLVNPLLFSMVYANVNYTHNLKRGTQILEVKKYDEATWKNTVNVTSTPSDWFGGDADKIGARSKMTLFYREGYIMSSSELFFSFVLLCVDLRHFQNITNNKYNNTFINTLYPNLYNGFLYHYEKWNFTIKEFDTNTDYSNKKISYIIRNPENFSMLLNNYNNFAGMVNNDTKLQLLNYTFPFLDGDDFVWQFITWRYPIPNPKNEYLNTFISTIGCKNTTIQGNTLVLQRYGEKNYIIEVTYGVHGLVDYIVVKDAEGYVFYKITSFYPKTVVNIILGILVVFVLGIIILIIVQKYKQQRYFNQTI